MLYGILYSGRGRKAPPGTANHEPHLDRGKIVKMNAIRIDKTLPVKLIQLNPINGKVQVGVGGERVLVRKRRALLWKW